VGNIYQSGFIPEIITTASSRTAKLLVFADFALEKKIAVASGVLKLFLQATFLWNTIQCVIASRVVVEKSINLIAYCKITLRMQKYIAYSYDEGPFFICLQVLKS